MRDPKRMNISKMRQAQVSWLAAYEFGYFVTLATNWQDYCAPYDHRGLDKRAARLHKRIKKWEARVNRKILGSKWKNSKNRMFAMYFMEHMETNIHVHLLIQEHRGVDSEEFSEAVDVAWSHIVKSGTTDVKIIQNISGAITYILKEAHLPERYENFDVLGKPQGR